MLGIIRENKDLILEKDFIIETLTSGTLIDHAKAHNNTAAEDVLKSMLEEETLEKLEKEPRELMLEAIKNGDTKQAEQLIKNGFDVNFRYERNITLLLKAIDANQSDIAELFIKNDAIKLDLQDNTGVTALLWAIHKKLTNIIKLLIEKNANLELQDKDGETALTEATLTKQPDIVKLLINLGANVNVQNNSGQTPLHIAAKENNRDIVKLLTIEGNAKAIIQDKNRKIAADYAQSFSKISKYLYKTAEYQYGNQRRRNGNNTRSLKQATYLI